VRHAYLILAHEQAPSVRRLVEALQHATARFYIHVDATSQEDFERQLSDRPDVHFLPRTRVHWKGFSLVQATLNLMRRAQQDGFDYYTLISGCDYPIKSNDEIMRVLEASREQYLTFWRLEDRPSWQHKVQYHYPTDLIPMRHSHRSLLRWAFWGSFRRLRYLFPKRTFPRDLVPFGGSQWWSLTGPCVDYILDFVDARRDVVDFFRTTESPDELFFHTIVLNSPFASTVHGADEYEEWRRRIGRPTRLSVVAEKLRMLPDDLFNLRYIDWSGETTGLREAPAVLVESDLPALLSSPCLIARKFHVDRSRGLLAQVDAFRSTAPRADWCTPT
jgi:hypothetical protein